MPAKLLTAAWALAALAGVPASAQAPVRSRPADIAFNVRMIDPGFSESVAVADLNRDGRLDILSAEYWYQAPTWTKHKIRDIGFNGAGTSSARRRTASSGCGTSWTTAAAPAAGCRWSSWTSMETAIAT